MFLLSRAAAVAGKRRIILTRPDPGFLELLNIDCELVCCGLDFQLVGELVEQANYGVFPLAWFRCYYTYVFSF